MTLRDLKAGWRYARMRSSVPDDHEVLVVHVSCSKSLLNDKHDDLVADLIAESAADQARRAAVRRMKPHCEV